MAPRPCAQRSRGATTDRRPVAALGALARFYAVQLHLLRRWSGGRAALLKRGSETAGVSLIALAATAWLVPGISVRSLGSALVGALVLAALRTLARPLLVGLLSGLSVALAALATVLVDALAFWLLAQSPAGIAIASLGDAALGALLFSFVSALLTAGLSIGDDRSFFGTLVRQLAARHRDTARTGQPGLVLIQLDGVALSVLEHALQTGGAPNLHRWIRSGTMRLDPWEALLPSLTPASQAGILHGNNDGIPAFRWWDKRDQRLLVSNHPADAREIMRRVSNGRGLLADGGASIGNLVSGDASRSYLTAATVDDPAREARRSHVLDWFFISPYSYVRWLVLSVGEIVKELVQARRVRVARVGPRGDRGFPYPLARAATNVLLRHLTTALVIEEMYRGAPRIYMDFVDYDEIAHHSGPAGVEARDAIAGLDRMIALIERAALDAPRPYRFIVLSDHGQSPGAMFRQRYGRTLEGLVGELVGEGVSVHGASTHVEHWGRLTPLIAEVSRLGGLTRALTRRPLRQVTGVAGDGEPPDIVVAASGNLALVSFPRRPGRTTRESIEATYPRLIAGLAKHPGVGLVMVRSASFGAVALGAAGVNYLDAGRVEGVDPLARFGVHALAGLRRLDSMSECGDLVVISQFDPASGEVAAFENQIGTHGGLGGAQSEAFVLHPAEWPVEMPLVGAPAVHTQIRRWLDPAPERENLRG